VGAAEAVEIRRAKDADRHPLALLFAEVAEERDGIAAEPPIDVEKRAASWDLVPTLVALAAGDVVGVIFVVESAFGFGEIGMMVAAGRRGRGIGTALGRRRRRCSSPPRRKLGRRSVDRDAGLDRGSRCCRQLLL
jgi:GNAT superfamily N-acetyltransferase